MTTRRLSMAIIAFALPAAVCSLAQTANLIAAGEAAKAQRTSVPKIRLAEPVFDFGKIGAGSVVRHDYFFSNIGGTPLLIIGVHTSCDCTTVGKWSSRLDVGQTGVIPIQFNSTGYGGAVNKRIMVTTNDPAQRTVVLTLKGMVSNPIEVSPPNAVFTPVAGMPVRETKVIRITNNTKEPLALSAPECANRTFALDMKIVRPGKEFKLRITTVPPYRAGTVVGFISIKTNLSQVPVITVTALTVVRKQVTALPTRIWLPAGPLPTSFQTHVTIQNNAKIAGFAVSDPIVNLPGVTAVVKNVQAGRIFSVLLRFPAGLELPSGSRAELTVKTTHPRFPVIKVPIHQDPPRTAGQIHRPAVAQAPGSPATSKNEPSSNGTEEVR